MVVGQGHLNLRWLDGSLLLQDDLVTVQIEASGDGLFPAFEEHYPWGNEPHSRAIESRHHCLERAHFEHSPRVPEVAGVRVGRTCSTVDPSAVRWSEHARHQIPVPTPGLESGDAPRCSRPSRRGAPARAPG